MTQSLHAVSSHHADPVPGTLQVLVADGQGLVRAGFKALVEGQQDMRVAAEASTVEEAVVAARETRPDVALIDLNLPLGGGTEAAHRILESADAGDTRIVMLLGSPSDVAVLGALRAGATGLLLKDAEPGDLLEAVRVVATGDALLAPSLARTLVADFLSRPERLRSTPEQLDELTPREREVVALVACGMSNEEIAERLVVTRATAKTHVSRALCKLHARDRAQLVVMAYEAGLVRPGPGWVGPRASVGLPLPVPMGDIGRPQPRAVHSRRALHAVPA
jgi:DNA-binding NarL/FixJ family response regulator